MCVPLNAQQAYTLKQCQELALKNNIQAKNAELSVQAAKQQKDEAFTKYFPSVSLSGTAFQANKPILQTEIDPAQIMQPITDQLMPLVNALMPVLTPMLPPDFEMPSLSMDPVKIDALKNGFVGGAMATQPVFAGGQIVNGNRLAKAGVEVRQLQKQMTRNEVLLTTERYFWQIVSMDEKMKTIESSATMLDRILSDVKIAVEAGLTTRNDLLRVELERNKLESNRSKVENGLEILKMTFALHIGVPADSFDIQAPGFSEIYLPPANNDTSLLPYRAEYQLLEKSVDIAKMNVDMEIGKNLPTVAIGAGYQYMRFDMNRSNGLKNDFGMVFATVSVPITDWWGGSHAIKRKKFEYQAAENSRKENADLLLLQMKQLRNELNEAYQQVLLAQKSISVAGENLRMSEDNYHAGITTLSDLLEAQNLLQQSRDQYTEAMTDYYVKLAEYRQMSEF
jgi:Outer membrane protein